MAKRLSGFKINVAVGADVEKLIKEAKEKYEVTSVGVSVTDSHVIREALIMGLRAMIEEK